MSRKRVHRIVKDQDIPVAFYQFCHKRVSFLLEPIMIDEKPLHFLLANAYYQGLADAVDVAENPNDLRRNKMVRAKFTVSHIDHQENTSGTWHRVVLEPRYDESIPEDQRFCEATPSGRMEMTITNPAVLELFKPGKQFYVDFTETPKP